MKVTAIAHPIQGLIKYHGLKDPARRIPFHDSISVCSKALNATTTVDADQRYTEDSFKINGSEPAPAEVERMKIVLDAIRRKARVKLNVRVESMNSLKDAKGVGFSAAGMAALGYAANQALQAGLPDKGLSEAVRLGAGSATRSLAGGFAVWYADRGGSSYAERIMCPIEKEFRMLIAPLPSKAKTDQAHQEVLTSPFFTTRVATAETSLKLMTSAIENGSLEDIGQLAENDSLNMHAVTMTGTSGMLLWEPETVEIMKAVRSLRAEQRIPCWFSIDTGPSVFVNTDRVHAQKVRHALKGIVSNVVESSVGNSPQTTDQHLF